MDTNDARRQIHLSMERNIGETQFIGENLRKDSGVMDVESPGLLSLGWALSTRQLRSDVSRMELKSKMHPTYPAASG
jgi:hypothetical protein